MLCGHGVDLKHHRAVALFVLLVLSLAGLGAASPGSGRAGAGPFESGRRIVSLLPADATADVGSVATVSAGTLAGIRPYLDFLAGTGTIDSYEPHLGDGLVIASGPPEGLPALEEALGHGAVFPHDAEGLA